MCCMLILSLLVLLRFVFRLMCWFVCCCWLMVLLLICVKVLCWWVSCVFMVWLCVLL